MNIVEINDNDVYGKIFNGYLIMEELNKKGNNNVKQLIINKFSNNPNCIRFFPSDALIDIDFSLHKMEHDIMSTHSLLSISSLLLQNNKYYKKCDLAHFHQVHNCRFCLPTFFKMAKTKPTVISFHDPWYMTGRCVHPFSCDKWKTGCVGCKQLDSLFDLPRDNCSELWNIKKEIENTDIDIIVHSKFMFDMVKQNPYTKNLRVHEIPLGIDIKKFNFKYSKEEAKRKLNIFPSDIVIFFREQEELKGTNYIVKALKKLKNKSGITLLTCSQKGLLKELEDDFNIIECGVLQEEDILLCYNASDLFLMPSLGESFGMMAVEAMAAGVPTIVFDNSALPTTTGAPEVGILVKNLDADDLYKKIEYYIENPKEREKRAVASKKYVTKKYDYETFFRKIEEVYEQAYENQKYKFNSHYNANEDIDFDEINTKLVSNKLIDIYDKLFSKATKPDFLKSFINIKNNRSICYSNANVLRLIEKFNEYVYKISVKKKNIHHTDEISISSGLKSENPKVSIIIPVYNGEKYVSLAIDSALRQTYNNVEVIVVNDGSTDRTDKICKSYGNKIKYIKKENGGVSTALNTGIKNMTGEYFSWLSHDDLYYPEKISVEIEYLRKNKLFNTDTIIYSDYSKIDSDGKIIDDILFDSVDLNRDSAFSIIKGGINGLTLLIPKKAFENVGMFDEKLRCVQDYKLWFDMYKYGYKFIHIPNILTVTRIHQESTTNTSPRVVTEGNEFWVDVINYFSDKEKIRLYDSVYNYYFSLYNFFNGGPYDKVKTLCEKKIRQLENKVSKDSDKVKVSVIISFHNKVASTIRSLNSVLKQTHSNYEVILINNGSKEDVSDIDAIVSNNKNVKYIVNKDKKNLSSVYNMGIKESSGEYVAFLKNDSIFDNEKIKKQLLIMLSSGSIISHTSYNYNYNNSSVFMDSGYLNGYVRHKMISDCDVNISTVMINRKYIIDKNIYFDEKISAGEDICFYLDILKDKFLLGIREPLTNTIEKDKHDNFDSVISVINYLKNKDEYEKYYNEVIKLIVKNQPLLEANNDIYDYSKKHRLLLEKYQYMQTKEYKYINTIRRKKNKLLFRKDCSDPLLSYEEAGCSRLNRYWRGLRKIRNRIKKRGE